MLARTFNALDRLSATVSAVREAAWVAFLYLKHRRCS